MAAHVLLATPNASVGLYVPRGTGLGGFSGNGVAAETSNTYPHAIRSDALPQHVPGGFNPGLSNK